MARKTPIAIFTYNRPLHTQRMLTSLESCYRLDECQPFIYCDGIRLSEHEVGVKDVRKIVWDWAQKHSAVVVERLENMGVARSIVEGVTKLCDDYGCVVVIEDDLVLHPSFIQYMLTALDQYKYEEQVAQVSAYLFPIKHIIQSDGFFLPLTTSWGWAVWVDRWKLFRWDAPDANLVLDNECLRFQFDFNGVYPYSKLLQDRLLGLNESWAILFYWAAFHAQKLTLYPAQSLVQNIGYDGSGYHYTQQSYASRFVPRMANWQMDHVFKLPMTVKVDTMATEQIHEYLYKIGHPYTSFVHRIGNFIKPLFKRPRL